MDQKIVDSHKKVMRHFGIEVMYHAKNQSHFDWMDEITHISKADIIGFIDIDCVPINPLVVDMFIKYAATNNSFIGPAQVSNHIAPATHIFAAPSFLFISTDCYERLGRPSFSYNYRSDAAEEISHVAESMCMNFKTIYPTKFEEISQAGIWRLGSYGCYGIGTVYDDLIYHLYESRICLPHNITRFQNRCDQIIDSSFSSEDFYSCKTFDIT